VHRSGALARQGAAFKEDTMNPRYAVTFLGTGLTPRDINNTGTIVGTQLTPIGERAFIMRYGLSTLLGTMGGLFTVPARINAEDAVTGWTAMADAPEAFLYDGFIRTLGTLGGRFSVGTALNNANQVVGYSETSGGLIHGFLYANGAMLDLGTIGEGTYSIARDINLRGQIVGETAVEGSPLAPIRPFLYERGVMSDLGSFGGFIASAAAINEDGWIAGYSTDEREDVHLFLIEAGIMRDLGNFGGFIAPRAMNNSARIVGIAEDRTSSFPFIYIDGVLTKLETLVDPALGWRIDTVYGINDRGQVVGTGCNGALCGGLLLTPIT
jgi:probable HAF family extracellular repeat protein